jgi:L-serine dehydratase
VIQRISVFDMFKIGVGPSSSHTLGPWRAAQRFLQELTAQGTLSTVSAIGVDLFGSLAKTGKGHGTPIALQLGLTGEDPETIEVGQIKGKIAAIAAANCLRLAGRYPVPFRADNDIRYRPEQKLEYHPNALRLTARLANGLKHSVEYYSVGGGFVVTAKEYQQPAPDLSTLPYPFDTASKLLEFCDQAQCSISELVMRNELSCLAKIEVQLGLDRIWSTMLESIYRGCHTQGELPGGLRVQRRAAAMSRQLLNETENLPLEAWLQAIRHQPCPMQNVLNWVSCFALAVNEENASLGRIVTAPTNGAAGVVPAVLLYYLLFCEGKNEETSDFLLTAGEIGSLFKRGATISAAQGGCQAEIGVSSAMAAAALTERLGGSAAQTIEAAEIAMEHHLGLTCDPVGGLVQIPCIERNCMGAVKAITAAGLALSRDPAEARVSLDEVIKTMWVTAQDMNAKYKETAEGGLAINIPVNLSEC